MSHEHMNAPADAIFVDGCAECDGRVEDPIQALLRLDRWNADLLWRRMLGVKRSAYQQGVKRDNYRSENEARVGELLYYIGVYEERNAAEGSPYAWDPDRFRPPVLRTQ